MSQQPPLPPALQDFAELLPIHITFTDIEHYKAAFTPHVLTDAFIEHKENMSSVDLAPRLACNALQTGTWLDVGIPHVNVFHLDRIQPFLHFCAVRLRLQVVPGDQAPRYKRAELARNRFPFGNEVPLHQLAIYAGQSQHEENVHVFLVEPSDFALWP